MGRPLFKTAEVDYLVETKKTIRAIPRIEHDAYANEDAMCAEVRKKDNPGQEISLRIEARVTSPISGIPRALPRCLLLWRGQRIRGLDYAITHDRPGTVGDPVKGWHEHRYNEQEADAYIVKASPQLTKLGLEAIFRWGLKKWNIEVEEEQLEVSHGN